MSNQMNRNSYIVDNAKPFHNALTKEMAGRNPRRNQGIREQENLLLVSFFVSLNLVYVALHDKHFICTYSDVANASSHQEGIGCQTEINYSLFWNKKKRSFNVCHVVLK